MNISHRDFLFHEDGTVVRIPNPKFFAFYRGEEPLKEFTNERVRRLHIMFELQNKQPFRIVHYRGFILYLDSRGFIRKDKQDEFRKLREAADFSWGRLPPPEKETTAQREARERLKRDWEWEPTRDELAAVEKILWPKGKP